MPSGYTLANISPSVILRQNKSLVKSFGLTELGLFRPGIVCQLQVKLPKLLKKQKTVVWKLTASWGVLLSLIAVLELHLRLHS